MGGPWLDRNRQVNSNTGSLASFALHMDLAAMLLDDPMDDRQTQPGSGGLGGVERLKDVR